MSQKRDELLRVIGSVESNNNPNIMVGGKKVPLTSMTVGEVLKHQASLKGNTAAGEWQIKYDSLRSLVHIPTEVVYEKDADGKVKEPKKVKEIKYAKDSDGNLKLRNPTDFNLDTMFDATAQKWAANALLDRRGFKDYENGMVDDATMARSLSQEWASLPDPSKGTNTSFYSGDGTHDRDTKISVQNMYDLLNIQVARPSRPQQ